MIRPSPISTRTATLFPYTTLFRSPDGIRKSIVKVQNRTARGRFRRARADRDNAAPVFAFHIGRDGTYEMGETLHNVGVSAVQILVVNFLKGTCGRSNGTIDGDIRQIKSSLCLLADTRKTFKSGIDGQPC